MKCPVCGKAASIPENSRRNMESYQQSCVTVMTPCNHLVWATPRISFDLQPAQERTKDGWRRPGARMSAKERENRLLGTTDIGDEPV